VLPACADGAGGKGTWGKAGDEFFGYDVLDRADPSYDSEGEVESVMIEVSEVTEGA